jgi:hypothetical protein
MLEWDDVHDKARKKFHELIESRGSELPASRGCAKPAKCV